MTWIEVLIVLTLIAIGCAVAGWPSVLTVLCLGGMVAWRLWPKVR